VQQQIFSENSTLSRALLYETVGALCRESSYTFLPHTSRSIYCKEELSRFAGLAHPSALEYFALSIIQPFRIGRRCSLPQLGIGGVCARFVCVSVIKQPSKEEPLRAL